MEIMKKALLRLSDGTVFQGYSFGADVPVSGEVVFNTAMMGYPESLTDPSYAGQLMTLTYPLVGNYGVPEFSFREDGLATFMESDRIYARAIICSEYSGEFSHWNGKETLADWLIREGVPGITGIDTRALTMLLREQGVMMGSIEIEGCEPAPEAQYEGVNFVAQVSCKEVIRYNEGAPKKVILVDCGVKHNIIRCLINRNVEVIRVPWDYDFNTIEADGLFLSNGPGDPNTCSVLVDHIRTYMLTHKPIAGICMGNQLLGKAAGATIYKLPYGHRSHNRAYGGHQPLLHHLAKPRLCRRCFHPLQRVGTAVCQHERQLQRGHPTHLRTVVLGTVPSRSMLRTRGHRVPLRRFCQTPLNA